MGGFKKGIWIARDKNNRLFAYTTKPKKVKIEFLCKGTTADLMRLPSSWCKNIEFENSPVFIPLTEDFVKQFIKK